MKEKEQHASDSYCQIIRGPEGEGILLPSSIYTVCVQVHPGMAMVIWGPACSRRIAAMCFDKEQPWKVEDSKKVVCACVHS